MKSTVICGEQLWGIHGLKTAANFVRNKGRVGDNQ